MEGKYTDKSLGTAAITTGPRTRDRGCSTATTSGPRRRSPVNMTASVSRIGGLPSGLPVELMAMLAPGYAQLLMFYTRTGLTLTQTWNTANALETKLELADSLAKGLKAEGIFSFLPAKNARGAKFNLHFKQSNFHARAFFDLLKGPTANVDAVVAHEGFMAGGSAAYDVNKAAVTGYSAAVGYLNPVYTAAITATDNLSVFAASYYHKVNSQVEAGAKATWNSPTGNAVGLEVASKYRLDPVSFVKVCFPSRPLSHNNRVLDPVSPGPLPLRILLHDAGNESSSWSENWKE